MSIAKLDNEYASFLKAQAFMDNKAVTMMEVTCSTPLREYIDPLKLQARLDRFAEMKIPPEEVQFLQMLGGFDQRFLDSLEIQLPEAKVKVKDKDIKIQVKGTKSELALWRTPISVQIHDLYFKGVFDLRELAADQVITEGVRRFQVKLDNIRNSGVRFIETGTRYRYGYDWYSLLMPVILGDVGDLFLGTTNLQTAMAYGLKAYAPLDLQDLITVWPKDQVVPILGFTSECFGGRITTSSVRAIESVLDQLEGKPLYVADVTAYEMGHLNSHFGNQLVFEWGANLTADMGPAGSALLLEYR